MSLLMSRRDLEFLLYEWLDVERLTTRDRYADHSRETFDAALDLAETIATDHFAPHNKLADANDPRDFEFQARLLKHRTGSSRGSRAPAARSSPSRPRPSTRSGPRFAMRAT